MKIPHHRDSYFEVVMVKEQRPPRRWLGIFLSLVLLAGLAGAVIYLRYPHYLPDWQSWQAKWQAIQQPAPPAPPPVEPVPETPAPEASVPETPVPEAPVPEAPSVVMPPAPEAAPAEPVTSTGDIPPAVETIADAPQVSQPPPAVVEPTEAGIPSVAESAAVTAVADPPVSEAEALLAKARSQIGNMQLHEPPEDNAYTSYQTLLSVAPAQARGILDGILVQYLKQSRTAITNGDFAAAESIYRHAQRIAPAHQATTGMLNLLLDELALAVEAQISNQRLLGESHSAVANFRILKALAPEHPALAQTTDSLIGALVPLGTQQMAKYRYTTPEGDNAFETYRAVLELNPGHPEALAGLDKIAGKYAYLGKRELDKGRGEKARGFIKRGLMASPQHAGLLELQQRAGE